MISKNIYARTVQTPARVIFIMMVSFVVSCKSSTSEQRFILYVSTPIASKKNCLGQHGNWFFASSGLPTNARSSTLLSSDHWQSNVPVLAKSRLCRPQRKSSCPSLIFKQGQTCGGRICATRGEDIMPREDWGKCKIPSS